MSHRLSRFSSYMLRAMLALFLLISGASLILGATQDRDHMLCLGYAVVALPILWVCLPAVLAGLTRLGKIKSILFLSGLCLMVKLTWVLAVRVPISGDYAVFWGYANSLSTQATISGGRYLALFPHIFGYSQFLSFFIRLFGSSEWIPPIVNVLLTVCSGCLLFSLCLSWLSLREAISAYLFWIACPSQTIYNSLVLSEPFYTTLLLAYLLLITKVMHGRYRRSGLYAGLLAGIGGGILLRLIQGARPIASIWIIAVILWVSVLNPALFCKRDKAKICLSFVGVSLLIYLLSGPLWNQLITNRIGEVPSTTPGYSVLVGFNESSLGRWNLADSQQLMAYSSQPGSTAQWVQEQMLSDALGRISSGSIDYVHLFTQKLRIFLGSDDSCVSYSVSVLRHTGWFSKLCNSFYYLCVLCAVMGANWLCRERNHSTYAMVPLYVIGLTLAQMAVEVAGRYHYSIIPMLILMGQPALCNRCSLFSMAIKS